jgi:hypothetical protein
MEALLKMSEKNLTPDLPKTPPVGEAPAPATGGKPPAGQEVVRFISHSQLFYYWPIWLTSFIFAAITRYSGQEVTFGKGTEEVKVLFVSTPGLGLAFIIILMAVILFTSVNIRGVWAALTGVSMVVIGLLFHILSIWPPILKFLGGLNFYLSYHFYLTTGVALGTLWAVVFFIFDKRHYVEFRSTQLTVVEEVGDGARNFDAVGLVFDKKRDNFFQHWFLGFGSGDLVITTSGGQREQILFPNVLNIEQRVKQIHSIREQRGR